MTESVNNRTFTPLQAGRVFIGTYDTVIPFSTAVVSCLSDTECVISAFQSQNKVQTSQQTFNVEAGVRFTTQIQISNPYLYFTVRNSSALINGTQLSFTVIYHETQILSPSSGGDTNIFDSTGSPIVSTSGKLQVQDVTAEASLASIDAKLTTSRGGQVLWATPSTGAGGFSESENLTGKAVVNLTFYGNSNLATVLTVQFSNNGTTWFSSQYTYTLTSGGDWGFSIPVSPFYVRLTSSANVACNAILNYS